ncbi:MAG TPA: SDR family oxidoreductase [Solirubrobacteraceae bacterium]|jgi:NAD(P)-dependent dehydrogenase (short-subunit alcohol dehydrogenase family)|nr:SDR family oxidoreductase [Solirubrobacteraceae bacterium]
MPGRLEGKAALITGGAGSIGVATATAFVAEGARVLITDLDRDALAAAAGAIGSDAVGWRVADVTVEADVEAAVGEAVERFGQLDVVFANAGIFGVASPLVDYPTEAFERVLAVNVVGSMLVCKHAMRVMQRGASLIINSSVVGLTSAPGIAGYATSKHALVGLMRTAAKEMAPNGIRVNSVHPGPTDNEFQHRIEMQETGAAVEEATRIFDSMIPLGRHATTGEVAATVVFLASDESAFMTGHTLTVDGGLSV